VKERHIQVSYVTGTHFTFGNGYGRERNVHKGEEFLESMADACMKGNTSASAV